MRIGLVMPVSWESLLPYLPKGTELPCPLGFPFGSELAASLRKRGHEIHVFTLCFQFEGEKHVSGDGVHVHIAGYRRNFKLCLFDGHAEESRRLVKMIQEAPRCDVYNAHWAYEFARGVISAGVRHVVTVRDQPWKVLLLFKPKSYRFMRLILAYYVIAGSRHLSVASPYMADYLRRWHGVKRKIPIIPNAVKGCVPLHQRSCALDRPIVFVDMSNGFDGCKNIPNLLRAYALFREKYDKPSELRIFGRGNSEQEEAGRWMRENGCRDGVVLRGQVPHADMLSEIAAEADVLVHVSREESFGGVIAEAMSVGLPTIVGRDSGAAPWVAGYGETGYLVNVNNPKEIATAMVEMAEDLSSRESFSHASLERYNRMFTLDAVTDQYEALYKEVLTYG